MQRLARPLALLATVSSLATGQARHAPAAVSDSGDGPVTFVLVSGIVGGVAGFRRLEQRLLAEGHRVLIIDPYNLSIDSADVTFAALARRVDAVLAQRDVRGARVIAHAHGAGVALRLAASAPGRVSALYFLDVGALAANGSNLLTASLRLVPLVARMPGGRDFIRKRYLQGLRQNSARAAWIDTVTDARYAQPVVRDIDRVVALAIRLSRAEEPEPLADVVARIAVPVTLLLGAHPHPAGPGKQEMDALVPLGGLVRVVHLAGVGHFPHEEAPVEVAAHVLAVHNVARGAMELTPSKIPSRTPY